MTDISADSVIFALYLVAQVASVVLFVWLSIEADSEPKDESMPNPSTLEADDLPTHWVPPAVEPVAGVFVGVARLKAVYPEIPDSCPDSSSQANLDNSPVARLVFWPSRCAFGCSQVEPLRVSFCPHGCLYDQMRTEFAPAQCSVCNNPKCDSPCGKH